MIIKNKELEELYNKANKLDIHIRELKNTEIVKKYNKSIQEKTEILKDINNLEANIQKDCNHQIWYFLSSSTDEHEGRDYYICRCLDCDKADEDRSKYFKNVIKSNTSFSIIQEKYKELKELTSNIDLLFQLLKEQFEDKIIY